MDAADAAQTPDKITKEVLDQIKDIARDLSIDEPLWADHFAYDVFKAAVDELLSGHAPSGEAKPDNGAKIKARYGDEKPETIGRIIARHAMYAYGRERYGQAISDKLNKLKG